MEIFVNDDPIDSDPMTRGTVEDALRLIQSTLCGPGQLVTGLRCNGEDVPSDAMNSTLGEPLEKLQRLEVFTTTRAALVVDVMNEAASALDETDKGCRRSAELLSEGKAAEGVEALGECLGVWRQIHEAVGNSIKMLGVDADMLRVGDEPLAAIISKPKDVLYQVKEALAAKDYVLLADVLQYEFGEVTEQWRIAIARLQEEAKRMQTAQE